MFVVVAVIKPHKLDDVREAVSRVGVTGMTVTEVRGYGRQRGHTETYRGAEYRVDFLPKLRLEMVVDGLIIEDVLKALAESARTGQIGDGKAWVMPVETTMRIRTGERDRDAL